MVPRRHQVNQPRFFFFLKPHVPFLPTGWSGEPGLPAGVEAAFGGPRAARRLPAPGPRPPGPLAPQPRLHVFAASTAGARSQQAARFVPRSPPAPKFTFCTGRPPRAPCPGSVAPACAFVSLPFLSAFQSRFASLPR